MRSRISSGVGCVCPRESSVQPSAVFGSASGKKAIERRGSEPKIVSCDGAASMIDPALISKRRDFKLPGYSTLADVCLDGDYVSPPQMASCSPTGPVLLAYHWLDAPSARKHRSELREFGYLRRMIFNKVICAALKECGLSRADIYITQAFHLLPSRRSGPIRPKDVNACFTAITQYELHGRKVIALGKGAARACCEGGIKPNQTIMHPSARGISKAEKIKALVAAIRAIIEEPT
jgi:hypothetical protein